MQKIVAYKTSDGVVHISLQAAQRHADDRYGRKLFALVNSVRTSGNFATARQFVDNNMQEFDALVALKRDLDIMTEQEEV